MTDREKLIKLLWDNYNDHPYAFSGMTDEFEYEADYLISHGATVREKGDWYKNIRGRYCIVCSVCGYGFPTEGFAWIDCNRASDEHESAVCIADVKNFCPQCGSDMREAKGGIV